MYEEAGEIVEDDKIIELISIGDESAIKECEAKYGEKMTNNK